MKNYFLAFILVFVFCAKAVGSNAQDKQLELVGEATLSYYFWDVYDIKLFADKGKYVPNQASITLELTYHREIKAKVLIEETEKQWRRFELDEVTKNAWLKKLSEIWPNVKKSDSITFHVDQQYYTLFYFNNEFVGKIDDREFSIAFSNIWLGANGPFPKITKALIGKKE